MPRRKGTMVYLSAEEKADLEQMALEDGRSFSETIRSLIRQAIKDRYTIRMPRKKSPRVTEYA